MSEPIRTAEAAQQIKDRNPLPYRAGEIWPDAFPNRFSDLYADMQDDKPRFGFKFFAIVMASAILAVGIAAALFHKGA